MRRAAGATPAWGGVGVDMRHVLCSACAVCCGQRERVRVCACVSLVVGGGWMAPAVGAATRVVMGIRPVGAMGNR
jgi:hypothetical protein